MKKLTALVLAGIVLAALLAFAGGATTDDGIGTKTDLATLDESPGITAATQVVVLPTSRADIETAEVNDTGNAVLICPRVTIRERNDVAFLNDENCSSARAFSSAETHTYYNGSRDLLLTRHGQGGPLHRWLRG